jgi:hypothetical protein
VGSFKDVDDGGVACAQTLELSVERSALCEVLELAGSQLCVQLGFRLAL